MAQSKHPTTVRLSEPGRLRIQERAQRADVDFSHMLRRMLAYADTYMPDGWVPPRRPETSRQAVRV